MDVVTFISKKKKKKNLHHENTIHVLSTMLKNSTKQTNSDAPVSPGSGPANPSGVVVETTPKPRKKLSFKEPEIFNYLKLKKPFRKMKLPPLRLTHSVSAVDFSFDENPFEEENDDLEELEVKVYAYE